MITRVLDAAIVLLSAILLLIAATGGLDLAAGAVRIRVHDWARPLILLVLAVIARLAPEFSRRLHAPHPTHVAHLALVALLIAAGGVYTHYHVRVAGGLDSYGYVSTAQLIANGRLRQPQPVAALLPFDHPLRAATPLGHVPSPDEETSVPRFPIGLPLVMALFTPLGPTGPFLVPLLLAFAAIAIAYLLGRDQADRVAPNHAAGLLAAALLAADPLSVYSAIQPMSDAPATFWLLAAVRFALHTKKGVRPLFWCVAAGVCGGMAMLTRTALVPAVVTLVAVSADAKNKRAMMAFGATVAVFILLQLAINVTLYGGIAMSGYGAPSHIFELSVSRLIANTSSFAKWLTYSHTPLVWLLWPGALFVLRHDKRAWQLSAVAAAAAAPYLFYFVFDDWEASRFLLPTIALVLILVARAAASLSPLIMVAIAFACAISSHVFLVRESVYHLGTLEAKYTLVGDWFKTNTSDRAVVLAGLHSGTIRMYGDRATIRWDEIPEGALTATVRALIDTGHEPFLALDSPSEPPLFEQRFATQPLHAEPVARVRVVTIYKFVSAY